MIAIINGPNLNLIGQREPEIYGTDTFEDYLHKLVKDFPLVEIKYFQSNCEGNLIDEIQRLGYEEKCKGIIFNPGAYSHYSYALADAISAVPTPVIEVHISNIHAREEFRSKTVTGAKARGIISGLGLDGYRLALLHLLSL